MEYQDIKYIVGLELGSSRAKIGVAGYPVDASGEPAGPLTVYDIVTRPTTDAVRYGRIRNVKDVSEILEKLVSDVENRRPVNGRKVVNVYIGVGGRSLKSTMMASKLELPERREITDDLIIRLKEDVAVNVPQEREILAIEGVNFTVDNILTPRPVGTLGTRLAGEFTVVTCDPSNVRDFKSVLLDRVGLGVCASSVRPLATANLVLTPSDAFSGGMLVDFGAETITVSVYKGGTLRYMATIPLGARLITRDLSTSLGVPEDEAEDIKLNMGSAISDPDSDEDHQIVDGIIGARLNDLVANICAQPGFAGFQPAELAAGIVLTGGGSKLRKFGQLLESVSDMKVRLASVPRDIEFADKALAKFENIDLYALLLDAAFVSRNPDIPECLSALKRPVEPVVTKQPEKIEQEPVLPKEEKTDPVHDERWDHPGYKGPDSPFSYDDGDEILIDDPEDYSPEECGPDDEVVDDGLLLLDSDEEDKKRKLMRDQQRRLADRERRIKEKEKKKASTPDRPSALDRFISKVANFVGKNTDGEGADLDD